jgi:hypothetical protein
VLTKTLREAQNFFKHADENPDAILEFSSAEAELFLLGACDTFREFAGQRTPDMAIFITWFIVQNPGMVTLNEATLFSESSAEPTFQPHQRGEFFAALIGQAGSLMANMDPENHE